MRGDVTNLTRAMLTRLAAASALISAVCFLVFITGNTGSLSGQAIAVASFGMGATGLAALTFALASVVSTVIAPIAGVRFSVSTLVVAIVSGLFGVLGILGAVLTGAISGGLSF